MTRDELVRALRGKYVRAVSCDGPFFTLTVVSHKMSPRSQGKVLSIVPDDRGIVFDDEQVEP